MCIISRNNLILSKQNLRNLFIFMSCSTFSFRNKKNLSEKNQLKKIYMSNLLWMEKRRRGEGRPWTAKLLFLSFCISILDVHTFYVSVGNLENIAKLEASFLDCDLVDIINICNIFMYKSIIGELFTILGIHHNQNLIL